MKCLICFHLVFWTIVGLISLPEAEALSWKRKPVSKSVAKGGKVTFYCEINDRNGASVVWNRGSTVISSNSQVQNVFSRYSIEGEFNLVINNVQEEDNESFTCNVFNLGAVSATLTVLLPPEKPIIKRNVTGKPYRENQVVKFTCESKGGNPVPTMKWFKNGQEIVNVVYSPASSIGETSSCDTIATLDSSDHQANYSCIVYNAANENSPVSASTVLQVQYSPFITFAPYNPYNILLGQNAQLECTVDSNPSVDTVNWLHNGQSLPNRLPTLTFNPVTKSDSGNYTCIANNGIGGQKQKIVKLNAVYPPEIQVPGSKTYREGEKIDIECVVDANPEPYQIQWEKVSGNQSTTIPQGSKLVIDSATRQDAGNYTCKAFSQLRVSGQSNQPMVRQAYTYIHIQFGPGEAFISPVSDVEVGKPLEIKCLARPEGYPAATYEWKKDNSVLQQTSSTYKITTAQLSDNGVYTCTPVNTVARGKSNQININVNEPPKIITKPPTAITLAITQTDMVTISCSARGRPPPVIHWFKDDSDTPATQTDSAYYTLLSKDVTFQKYSTEVSSTLQLKGQGRKNDNGKETALRIEDMGVYHCRVMSAVYTEPIKASQTLNLQFRPVVSTDQVRTAVNLSSPASLPCTAQAFPKPTFQWYYKGSEIFDSQARYSVEEAKINGISKFSSVLTIDSVNQADLGFYNCFVSNNLGNVSQTVHLTVKTVPEAPVKLRSTEQRWDSVMLQWDEGFNGGFDQQYVIQYTTGGEKRTQVVSPPTSTTYNLTKLLPDTTYSIVVFGRNRLGNGELSKPLIVKTAALSIPSVGPSIDFNVQSGVLDIEQEVTVKYCLRVSVKYKNKGSNWVVSDQCLVLLGKSVELPESNVAALNISVCLKDRPDVCGDPVSAKLSEEGETTLTEQDVYIIASVCGVIIVTLLIILVIFICRRRRNQAKYEENKTTTELRAQPVNGVSSPSKKPQVYENQGMSHVPGVDLDDPVPPSSTNVYSLSYPDSNSNNTNNNFSNSYGPLDLKHNHGNGHLANGHLANGHVIGNGSIPHDIRGHDTSYDSQIDKRVFENEMNRRNEYSTRVDYNNRQGDLHFHGMPNTKPKDQYLDLEEKKEGSLPSNPESGYSTPDPAKPKKLQFFKLKHREPNAFLYSDYSRYAHDPPGHTCGLPCCNENLRLELQGQTPRRIPGCIPAPVKYSEPNFTLRTKRNLIKGRPTFANKFLSLQPGNLGVNSKQRPVLPDFHDDILVGSCYSSLVKNKPKVNEWDHFYRKEIALPELPEDGDQVLLVDHDGSDICDDLDENEIGVVEIHSDYRGYPRPLQVPVLAKSVLPKTPEPSQTILESPTDEDYASGSASDKYTDYELSDSDYNTSSDHYYDFIQPLPLPKPTLCQKPKSCLKKTHRRKLSVPEKFSTLPKHFLSGKTKNFQSNSVAPYLPPVQNLFQNPTKHSDSRTEVWTVPVSYEETEQIYEDIVLKPEVPLSEVKPIVNAVTDRVHHQHKNSVVNSPLKKRSSSIDTHKVPWSGSVRGDKSSRKRVSFALDTRRLRRDVSRTSSMTTNLNLFRTDNNTGNSSRSEVNSLVPIPKDSEISNNNPSEMSNYSEKLSQNGSYYPAPCDNQPSALTASLSKSVSNSNKCKLDFENETNYNANAQKSEVNDNQPKDSQPFVDQGLSSLITNPVTLIL